MHNQRVPTLCVHVLPINLNLSARNYHDQALILILKQVYGRYSSLGPVDLDFRTMLIAWTGPFLVLFLTATIDFERQLA